MQQQINEQRPAAHEVQAEVREKKYVPPRMQVFPLDSQLLAASQAVAPVHVTIAGIIDWYGYYKHGCAHLDEESLSCDPTSLQSELSTYRYYDSADVIGPQPCLEKYTDSGVEFGDGGETWDPVDFLAVSSKN